MNADRCDFTAHRQLVEAAARASWFGRLTPEGQAEVNAELVADYARRMSRAPIQRKAIPAWLWLLTLAPWLVVGVECFA